MKRFAGVVFAVCVVLGWAAAASGQTLDEVLKNMSAKAETINDMRVTATVTKYDGVFDEAQEKLRMELWFKKPDLTRVETFKKTKTGEVPTQIVVIGKDYVLRCTPETRTGEITRIDAEKMKEARESRNDPMTFFSRKPEDLKKDFEVQLLPSEKPNTVKLTLKPRDLKTIDYQRIDLVVDKTTWLPVSVRLTAKGDSPDWALYEFTLVLLNIGTPEVIITMPPPGYTIKEVAQDAPEKK